MPILQTSPSKQGIPPVPVAHIVEAKHIGVRLLRAVQNGCLTFTNGDRDADQIRQIAAQGYLTRLIGQETVKGSPTPTKPAFVAVATLRTLVTLADRSTSQAPCELLGLYRPARSATSREPHSRGLGLDIRGFGGFSVDNARPQECVRMVVSLVNALPPRVYRIGLPKPPQSDPHGLEPPRPRREWPFLPPPLPRVRMLFGRRIVVPYKTPTGKFVMDKRGNFLKPEILAWENESAAPLSDVRTAVIRQAIVRARRRGADIRMLFPDAADHVHLDVATGK